MMSISDYYRDLDQPLRQEIDNLTDEAALEYERDSWITSLVAKYALERVERAVDRREQFVKRSGRPPRVLFQLPIVPSDTLATIIDRRLHARRIWSGPHSMDAIRYDPVQGFLSFEEPAEEGAIAAARNDLNAHIDAWNSDIDAETNVLREKITMAIDRRIREARETEALFDRIESTTGVLLVKKADLATVVPVAVSKKKIIAPLAARSREPRPVLDPDTVSGILELLDNQCRQFERTPSVFASLAEEDLRDIMLSTLNAVFDGVAVGEAFQGLGKADIHLRVSRGELFLSEVKWWDGPSSAQDATTQLLDRLTWQEGYGVVLILSKNAGFSEVRDSLRALLPTIPGAKGTPVEVEQRHFTSTFALPSDPSHTVQLHHMLYNLYTPRPSGRSAAGRRSAKT